MPATVSVKTGLKINDAQLQTFVDRIVAIEKMNVLRGLWFGHIPSANPRISRDSLRPDDTIRGRAAVPSVAALAAKRFGKQLSQPGARGMLERATRQTLMDPAVIEVSRHLAGPAPRGPGDLRKLGIPNEVLNSRKWHAKLDALLGGLAGRDEPGGGPPVVPLVNKQVALDIIRLVCIDETGGDWGGEWGEDEMRFGAVITENDKSTTLVADQKIGDFDDGDVVEYPNPNTIFTATLNADYTQPKIFTATLALAEEDNGGFAEWLEALYKAIQADLELIFTAIGAAAGAWIGAKIGGVLGTAVKGPIGAVIGALIGLIVGALVGFIVGTLKDDMFPPQMTALVLPATDSLLSNGGLVSDEQNAFFRMHYKIT